MLKRLSKILLVVVVVTPACLSSSFWCNLYDILWDIMTVCGLDFCNLYDVSFMGYYNNMWLR